MNKHPHPEDKLLVQSIASAIGKSIVFICLTIVAGMLFSTCTIDAATIQECESACGDRGIKEVTATSCECAEPESFTSSPFALP
jgi:hypothetical protein